DLVEVVLLLAAIAGNQGLVEDLAQLLLAIAELFARLLRRQILDVHSSAPVTGGDPALRAAEIERRYGCDGRANAPPRVVGRDGRMMWVRSAERTDGGLDSRPTITDAAGR